MPGIFKKSVTQTSDPGTVTFYGSPIPFLLLLYTLLYPSPASPVTVNLNSVPPNLGLFIILTLNAFDSGIVAIEKADDELLEIAGEQLFFRHAPRKSPCARCSAIAEESTQIDTQGVLELPV